MSKLDLSADGLQGVLSPFWQSAWKPEAAECHFAYVEGTGAVVLLPFEGVAKAAAESGIMTLEPGKPYHANDSRDPKQESFRKLFSKLEEEVGFPVNGVEISDKPSFLGRCTTAHLGFKDKTEWHESKDLMELLEELGETYGVSK